MEFFGPTDPEDVRTEVFVRYLDYFRASVLERVVSLPEDEWRRSRLPSAWTPLELVAHLTYVERRWLEWGFEGRKIEDPWGDRRDDRWHVDENVDLGVLAAALEDQGRRTRDVIRSHDLDDVGQPGPRWEDPDDPPVLERVLLHLLQEYARHLGHLDVVAELAGGSVGE